MTMKSTLQRLRTAVNGERVECLAPSSNALRTIAILVLTLSVILTVAVPSGVVSGPTSARAATDETLIDDLEDGTTTTPANDNWNDWYSNPDGIAWGVEDNSGLNLEGSYSIYTVSDGTNADGTPERAMINRSEPFAPDLLKYELRLNKTGSDYTIVDLQNNSNPLISFRIESDGQVSSYNGSSYVLINDSYTFPAQQTVDLEFDFDWTSEEYTVYADGARLGTAEFRNASITEFEEFRLLNSQAGSHARKKVWVDNLRYGVSSAPDPTYSQTFALDDRSGLFPPDRSTLTVSEWDPGAKSLDGPTSSTEWSYLESKRFNAQDEATVEFVDGDYYKVEVSRGGNSWEIIGYEANSSDTSTTLLIKESTLIEPATPTQTPTATREPLTPYPNGTTPTPYPTLAPTATPAPSVEGPTVLGYCEVPGAEDRGLEVEYWDESYSTTSFNYNLTGPDGALYEGTKTFEEEPIGYYRGCIGNATLNGTDPGDAGGNYSGGYGDGGTFNGSFSWPEASFGGPVGGGGGSSTATTYGGWLLLLGGGYLAYRRFGDGQLGAALGQAGQQLSRRLGR